MIGISLWLLLTLGWTFPRAYTPPPDTFTLWYTDASGQALEERQTPSSAVGACPGDAADDTYCTVWPTCPPPGVMAFFVQAVWGAQASDPSNVLTCVFDTAQPCVCQDPATYVPPPGLPDPMAQAPLPPGEMPPVTHVTLPPPPAFAPVFPPAPA